MFNKKNDVKILHGYADETGLTIKFKIPYVDWTLPTGM